MKSHLPGRIADSSVACPTDEESGDLLKRSLLYQDWITEREEILRHKWIESEKAGQDIGFDKALLSWIVRHRAKWRDQRVKSGSF